jgi:hypothetical protein
MMIGFGCKPGMGLNMSLKKVGCYLSFASCHSTFTCFLGRGPSPIVGDIESPNLLYCPYKFNSYNCYIFVVIIMFIINFKGSVGNVFSMWLILNIYNVN